MHVKHAHAARTPPIDCWRVARNHSSRVCSAKRNHRKPYFICSIKHWQRAHCTAQGGCALAGLYEPAQATGHRRAAPSRHVQLYARRPWLTADLRRPQTRLGATRLHGSDFVGCKTILSEKREKKQTISFPGGGEHPLCTRKQLLFSTSEHAVLNSVNETSETSPLTHNFY